MQKDSVPGSGMQSCGFPPRPAPVEDQTRAGIGNDPVQEPVEEGEGGFGPETYGGGRQQEP